MGSIGAGLASRLFIRPRTLGSLGAAYYRAGDKVKALEYTQKALEVCRQAGDQEGVKTYAGNIQHIQELPANWNTKCRTERGLPTSTQLAMNW